MPVTFNEDDKVKTSFVKWDKIGMSVQGTYISRREQEDRLNGGTQMIYEIKQEDGTVLSIGGRKVIDNQMRGVRLGQIIEFRYIGDGKPSKPGLNGAKIINVYSRPDAVDKEWLMEQENNGYAQTDQSDDEEIKIDEIPFKDPETTPGVITTTVGQTLSGPSTTLSPVDQLAMIIQLTQTKLGVSGGIDQVKMTVMQKLGIAFTESNYQKIIDELSK